VDRRRAGALKDLIQLNQLTTSNKNTMKTHLLFFAAVLISNISLAQKFPTDPETKKITYTEVIEVPGLKKEDLYNRAKAWFVTATGATKLALELEDKETGKLLGKVNNPIKINNPPLNNKFEVGSVIYNITVIVKDDKYKYTFTDFTHDSDGRAKIMSCGAFENKKSTAKSVLTGEMPTNWQWNKIKSDTEEQVMSQIESLKKALASAGKKETDF
jgi:hypothetical protein